ncbi:hypothetical protein BC939DRAFT_497123 [Gamsiella multidivaricata]|uniref:uncharacterized protein n=1 Tax=Gamsiella multidivaricata TaxID=101098 RepID=UPI002220676C|nr:uncharacterized protein BC939DRAFT_497123 [Gamsiella multidivaricata]KAI7816795.1 hypothetical protein BC939DRAFT_497123 [Gamsiella multidivaricata]
MKIREPWSTLMSHALLMHSDWPVNLLTEEDFEMDVVGSSKRRTLFRIALENLEQVQELKKKDGFDKFRCIQFKGAFIKHVLTPIVGGIVPSEADSVHYWVNVIEAGLPLGTPLRLHLGETGSTATAVSKSALAEVFEVGKEARKCDCLLRVDGLEVGNFEAKRQGCPWIEAAVQLRKNSKIAKSIFLQLEHLGVSSPPTLNIQGASSLVRSGCSQEKADMNTVSGSHKEKMQSRGDSKQVEAYLEWEKVVFHTPTKPISNAARPSPLDSLKACKDDGFDEKLDQQTIIAWNVAPVDGVGNDLGKNDEHDEENEPAGEHVEHSSGKEKAGK